jgi:hypothetical protein
MCGGGDLTVWWWVRWPWRTSRRCSGDGADAQQRIRHWQETVQWSQRWGSVSAAGGNGSSGQRVVDHVLQPLGVGPEQVYFTDCVPTYFIKSGTGSQTEAIRDRYSPFAAAQSPPLTPADLPARPSTSELVHHAVNVDGPVLRSQIADAAAPTIVNAGWTAPDFGGTGTQARPRGITVDTPETESRRDLSGPSPIVPRSLQVSAALGWRLLVVAAALYVIGFVASHLAAVVIPVAIALLLAALLAPAVGYLVRRKVPRWLATVLVLIGGLAVLGGLLTFVIITFINGLPALQT